MGGEEFQLGSDRRGDIPLSHRDILDGVHQLGDPHVLRAPLMTGIAGGTEPDELAGKDLLLQPEKGHPDDLSRIVAVCDLPDRTTRGAGPAGETSHDMLTAWFFGDEILKPGVKLFYMDHNLKMQHGS